MGWVSLGCFYHFELIEGRLGREIELAMLVDLRQYELDDFKLKNIEKLPTFGKF